MAAVALLVAGRVLRAELERRAGRGEEAFALVLGAGVGGLIGARVYWYLEHLGSASLTDGFSGAGFTWYGGAVGGTVAVLMLARHRKIEIAALLGACAPALAIGYAIGRVACQLAGDGTYGRPSSLPWAMSYPHGEVPTTQRVHPTPVYETLAGLIIFAVIWRLRHRLSAVRLFAVYLVASGAERFAVEFLRVNEPVMVGLTQPQLFGLALALAGATVLALPARVLGRPVVSPS